MESILFSKEKISLTDEEGLILTSLGYKSDESKSIEWRLKHSDLRLILRPSFDSNAEKFSISTMGDHSLGGAWEHKEVVRQIYNGARVVVAYKVKAGEYDLIEQYARLPYGILTKEATIKIVPSRKLSVKGGQITYIGAYELQTTTGTNIFGHTVPYKASFINFDEQSEDLALMYEIHPELKGTTVNKIFTTEK